MGDSRILKTGQLLTEKSDKKKHVQAFDFKLKFNSSFVFYLLYSFLSIVALSSVENFFELWNLTCFEVVEKVSKIDMIFLTLSWWLLCW